MAREATLLDGSITAPPLPSRTDVAPPLDRRALPVLLAFIFLSVATGTMVNVALPYIGRDLGASESTYAWIVTGFTLTFGVFSAIHGRLGDLLGVRRLYLAGTVGFGVFALLSAVAPDIRVLIALRVLHGVFAAAVPSLGTTAIARLLPPERRGAAMGAVVATVGVSASLSPFLGGLLVQAVSWRLVFVAPAVGLLLVPLAARVLPRSLDVVPPGGRFDVVGATLLGGGAGVLLLATDLVQGHGLDGVTLGAAASGIALLAGFVAWSRRVERPFAPLVVLGARGFQALVAAAALANATRFGTLVLVPIALEGVYDANPFATGLSLAPGALVMAVCSPLAGRLSDRYGPRAVAGFGLLGMLAATLLSARAMDHGAVGLALGMTAYGAAFAFVQPPLLGSIGRVVAKEHYGVANGLFLMVFFLGGAFGVAISVTVLALQPETAPGWLPTTVPGAGRYANAVLGLAILATAALALVPTLPTGDPPLSRQNGQS